MKRYAIVSRVGAVLAFAAIAVTAKAADVQDSSGAEYHDLRTEVVSIIQLNDVPLLDGIKNLLRHAGGLNFIVDPRVPGSSIGPGSRRRMPGVNYRQKNVTLDQALQDILKKNKLVIITNPATRIARLAPVGVGVKPVTDVGAGSDTNVQPEICLTGRLDSAIRRVAEQAQLSVGFDPSIFTHRDLQGDIAYCWTGVTARQALVALIDNYGLVMTEDPDTSRALVSLPEEQNRRKGDRKHNPVP